MGAMCKPVGIATDLEQTTLSPTVGFCNYDARIEANIRQREQSPEKEPSHVVPPQLTSGERI